MVHWWDRIKSIKFCSYCGMVLCELCFIRETVPCKFCGLWLVGKCPVYSNKRTHPLSNDEEAFISRLKEFDDSEWIVAATTTFDSLNAS
jgi:hypothetical protein